MVKVQSDCEKKRSQTRSSIIIGEKSSNCSCTSSPTEEKDESTQDREGQNVRGTLFAAKNHKNINKPYNCLKQWLLLLLVLDYNLGICFQASLHGRGMFIRSIFLILQHLLESVCLDTLPEKNTTKNDKQPIQQHTLETNGIQDFLLELQSVSHSKSTTTRIQTSQIFVNPNISKFINTIAVGWQSTNYQRKIW